MPTAPNPYRFPADMQNTKLPSLGHLRLRHPITLISHFNFALRTKPGRAVTVCRRRFKPRSCNQMSWAHKPTRRQTIKALGGLGAAGTLPASGGAWAIDAAPGIKNAEWLTLPLTPILPVTTRKGVATINGTDIFYAQFGQGAPVVLLHGGLANSNYWGHQIEHLAPNFTVIVMDTRGHGRSALTSRSFSYGLFAEDAAGLLDFLKIPRVSIVGWSDGAVTGLQLAMKKPDRVSKLFAFGGNSSADGLKPNGARSSVFVKYAGRCRAEYALLSPHPERWPQLLDGLRNMWRTEPNFTKRDLAAVKTATTISDGEHDEIIKRDHTEMMSLAIPHARLVMLPGVSHFAMLQDPGQFNRALTTFLAA
jgi:pimeloyl-ACP methyl ester carboxylesterase